MLLCGNVNAEFNAQCEFSLNTRYQSVKKFTQNLNFKLF